MKEKINWDLYRREDGTLRLIDVWAHHSPLITEEQPLTSDERRQATKFFEAAEQYHCITSRQVAALFLTVADANLEWFRS